MFEVGKIYKIKIETVPGQFGFGRATVVERKGNQLTIQVTTSKEQQASLPKGTRLWFVSDSSESFSGLWGSSVTESFRESKDRFLMVCSPPKLEPLYQRRRTPRVALDAPAQVWSLKDNTTVGLRTRDISRSGVALESSVSLPEPAEPGDLLNVIVKSTVGDIGAEARIIRVEKNWLANKFVVGLEFSKVPPESSKVLDKLLVLLGGKPRDPDAAADLSKPETGLASWISGDAEVRGHFVGTSDLESSIIDAAKQQAKETE